MNAPLTQPVFPFPRMLAWLIAAIAAMGAACALLLPVFLPDQPAASLGAAIAAAIVIVAAIIGALPLLKARDSAQLSNAFTIGMAIRLPIALIAALIATRTASLPEIPFVASLMVAYLPVLVIEPRFIIRQIQLVEAYRKQNSSSSRGSGSGGDGGMVRFAAGTREKLA